MNTIPKLIIVITIFLETIASSDMCMHYIKQATKNSELATLSINQKKTSLAINLF